MAHLQGWYDNIRDELGLDPWDLWGDSEALKYVRRVWAVHQALSKIEIVVPVQHAVELVDLLVDAGVVTKGYAREERESFIKWLNEFETF